MKLFIGVAKRFLLISIFLPIISCLSDMNFWSRGNVDLSKATWLLAEKVPLITDRGGLPGGGASPVPVNQLFNFAPGTKVSISSLGGAIDSTGTSIVDDFDGDGILNVNETTTNVWVSDYPVVEASIAPPITMKVAVWKQGTTLQDDLANEISADDLESGTSEGSEKIHQTELNLKTVQFQDSFSSSNSASGSVSASVEYGVKGGVGPVEAGMNFGMSASASWEASNSTSATTTKWADRPFKNNLDSDSQNLKANASSQKSRKYRADKSVKTTNEMTTKPDGGYVRAALYIKNNSVNMPVKLKNILCSLMFETQTGELIPVESFRLLKGDGSPFEIEVYGDTEFGPYVIEKTGLNGFEVERAIALGYNPKIFIVDYEMTHVKDSNYQSALLNFSGDNLKVIEENAKGRTALVKIIGPNKREMYRVTAFDALDTNDSNPCKVKTAGSLVPGISLMNALRRISCSGIMDIEFDDYVIDFSEIAPTLGESKIHIKGIKTLGGIQTVIPCEKDLAGNRIPRTGSDGQVRTACVQKPISQWTKEEEETAGIWAVYSKGKHYSPTSYYYDETGPTKTKRVFDSSVSLPSLSTFMVRGVDSTVWAGDTYDIVYIALKDLLKKQQQFGTNPLETIDTSYKLNTAWDLTSIGAHPYYPSTQSLFLGDAGFGEKVQLEIKLESTNYLQANFGTPQTAGVFQYFTDFSYSYGKVTEDRYDMDQAMDFEISLGLGGERSDWMHIRKGVVPYTSSPSEADLYKLMSCGKSLDHTNQIFKVCIQLPRKHVSADPELSLVKLYIRPALNSAYRRSAWPLKFSEVRKVQGILYAPIAKDDKSLLVSSSSIISDGGGAFADGNSLKVFGDPNTYTIQTVASTDSPCEPGTPNTSLCRLITLDPNTPIKLPARRTTSVYVLAGLTQPNVRLVAENNFFADWNSQYSSFTSSPTPGLWETPQYLSLFTGNTPVNCNTYPFSISCLGINTDYSILNWLGGDNLGVAHWNSWSDGGSLTGFLQNGLPNLVTSSGRSYRLEANLDDFTIAQNAEPLVTTSNNSLPFLSNITVGGKTLSIWKSGVNIYGRVYDISNSVQTSEVKLNTSPVTPSGAVPNIIAKDNGNGIVLLLYESQTTTPNDTIIVNRIKIDSNGTLSTTPGAVMVSNRTAPSMSSIDLIPNGTHSVVIWNSVSGTNFSGFGKIVSIAPNGNAVPNTGTDFTFLNAWAGTSANSRLLLSGASITGTNIGVIAFAQITISGSSNYGIAAVVLGDINAAGSAGTSPLFQVGTSTNAPVRQLVPVSGAGTGSGSYVVPMVVGTFTGNYLNPNPKAFVAWVESPNGVTGAAGTITGRGLLADTVNYGLPITASNITLSDNGGGSILNSNVILSSELNVSTALLTYTKANRIYAKPIDLKEGNSFVNALLLDTSTSASSKRPSSAMLFYGSSSLSDLRYLVSWEHTDTTSSKKSIRGRIGRMSDFSKADGNSELILGKGSSFDQTLPALSYKVWSTDGGITYNRKALVTWLSSETSPGTLKGQVFDLINGSNLPYGANNFFVSPLIEREYSLKAKLSF
ncbi:LIC12048 family lipoprotein [Leptospira koniambonensis]|uniref:LIC12048 family lipoprotein n=1 Tax=Leptospira koniambonensis TaxID=2484950 RepID=UPI003EB84B64